MEEEFIFFQHKVHATGTFFRMYLVENPYIYPRNFHLLCRKVFPSADTGMCNS